jgi:hypothetical protein
MFPDFDKMEKMFADGLKAIVDAINTQNDKLDRLIELAEKRDETE